MSRRRTLPALLGALLALALGAASAQAEVVWLCKPGEEPNPCVESTETTIRSADGSERVEAPPLPDDAPVDCFYVYPTVSGQPTFNSNKAKDPELFAVARQQASRFSLECEVYAPVYRQRTLLAIAAATPQQQEEAFRIAYADVREAWDEYLARHNRGRGVVLIGHSQGTRMLRQLAHDVIDPEPEVRRRIVSALLLGGNVLVRKGERAGGDFQHIPACRRADETGCAIAWSAYNEPPPDNTRYGRSPAADPGMGMPWGPDYEVLCTNPASLAGNERRPLQSIYRPELFPGLIGVLLLLQWNGMPPTASTPWVVPEDRYSARCEESNGANVLMIEEIGDAERLRPMPDRTWGLHLLDVNIALQDLVEIVRRQAAAYRARAGTRPRRRVSGEAAGLRLAYRAGRASDGRACARSSVRVALVGRGARNVRRMRVRVNGAIVAIDRRAPFRVSVRRAHLRAGAANRIAVSTRRSDGRVARAARSVLAC